MNIKYKNYTIEPDGANFNLSKEVDGISKGIKVKVSQSLGYGMRFTTCIDRIIKDTLADRTETVSLTHFVDEYRNIKNEITETIEIL